MFPRVTRVVFLFVFFAAALRAQESSISFNFSSFDYPGAAYTFANGISNSGEIVGYYQTDTSCNPYFLPVPNCTTHGFRYLNGKFAQVDISGSTSTAVMSINDSGDMVGFFTKQDNTQHGFLLYHTGTLQQLDYPGTGKGGYSLTTVAMGVNDALEVAGNLYSFYAAGPSDGFTWNSKRKFTKLDLSGGSTGIYGLSSNGFLVGQVFRSDYVDGFLRDGKDTDVFNRSIDTSMTGVDKYADIVGYDHDYLSGYFAQKVESREGSGDKEVHPNYMTIAYPGASTTMPHGINDSQTIVGAYADSNGTHGFQAVAVK
jgi:hypothetical protein